jgi:hypothetical protein
VGGISSWQAPHLKCLCCMHKVDHAATSSSHSLVLQVVECRALCMAQLWGWRRSCLVAD